MRGRGGQKLAARAWPALMESNAVARIGGEREMREALPLSWSGWSTVANQIKF